MESTIENYNMLMIKNNVTIVAYNIGFFQIKNIFLSDTKKNIIMDGKFTKIIYSDELITTHGIFLKIPFNPIVKQELQQVTILSRSPQYTKPIHIESPIGAKIVDEVKDFPRLVTRIGKAKHFEKGTNEGNSNLFHQGVCMENIGQGTKGPQQQNPDYSVITVEDSTQRLRSIVEVSNEFSNTLVPKTAKPSFETNLDSNSATLRVAALESPKFKQIYKLQSHDILNNKNINDIIRIEIQILEFYKQLFQCKKKIIFMLKEQLYEGNIKLYKEHFYNYIKFPNKQKNYLPNVILKISGIWETEDNIGLTYKFIEYTLDNSRKTNNGEL